MPPFNLEGNLTAIHSSASCDSKNSLDFHLHDDPINFHNCHSSTHKPRVITALIVTSQRLKTCSSSPVSQKYSQSSPVVLDSTLLGFMCPLGFYCSSFCQLSGSTAEFPAHNRTEVAVYSGQDAAKICNLVLPVNIPQLLQKRHSYSPCYCNN